MQEETYLKIKTNVTPTVAKISKMHLYGNITPHTWYKHIVKETESGKKKPDFLAIALLSDIVYWYRQKENRDESTGTILSYTKKFKADKLQKHYQAYANQFGVSKRMVKRSIDVLVNLKLITREFRNIMTDVAHLSNVVFLEPIPENIEKITYIDPKNMKPITKKDSQEESFLHYNTGRAQGISDDSTYNDDYLYHDSLNNCAINEHLEETEEVFKKNLPSSTKNSIEYNQSMSTMIPKLEPESAKNAVTYTEITTENTTKNTTNKEINKINRGKTPLSFALAGLSPQGGKSQNNNNVNLNIYTSAAETRPGGLFLDMQKDTTGYANDTNFSSFLQNMKVYKDENLYSFMENVKKYPNRIVMDVVGYIQSQIHTGAVVEYTPTYVLNAIELYLEEIDKKNKKGDPMKPNMFPRLKRFCIEIFGEGKDAVEVHKFYRDTLSSKKDKKSGKNYKSLVERQEKNIQSLVTTYGKDRFLKILKMFKTKIDDGSLDDPSISHFTNYFKVIAQNKNKNKKSKVLKPKMEDVTTPAEVVTPTPYKRVGMEDDPINPTFYEEKYELFNWNYKCSCGTVYSAFVDECPSCHSKVSLDAHIGLDAEDLKKVSTQS